MKKYIQKILYIATISMVISSCHNDLNQDPIDPDSVTEQDVFTNANEAKGALAKLYASLALTGQKGPAGEADISGIDEGFSQYSRMLFNLNELTTDHVVCGWGDPGVPDLHGQYWSSSNGFMLGMYSRLAQEVSFCNSFIANASKIEDEAIKTYIAEARFLRAFAYYNLIDMFANVPLTTKVSTELPKQSNRKELFAFVEKELLDIQENLVASRANEYGRVDKVAAWALLSKLYLNAEIWIGTAKWNEAAEYANKVINSSYTINKNDTNGNGTAYDELFLADNDVNGAQTEFIFPLNFDGIRSQTYGGSTFLIHAAIGGSMKPEEFGVNGGWAGLRTTSTLVNKFDADIESLNTALGTKSGWGLVGNSVPNGWNGPDLKMYETSNNVFAVYASLVSGEIKFRFNEDWGNNYGDNNADGSIEAGGDNIAVASAGTYYIVLNLNNKTFTMTAFKGDKRAMFHTDGQSLEIKDITKFDQGYAVTKFKNIKSDGTEGNDSSGNFTDTDIPLIRLAEIYLNYAEAVVRGGNGDMALAVSKINELRERAYGNTGGNISAAHITLDFLLDERSRELYWEGQRRTDLIRFGKFTSGDYLWPWKGNIEQGQSVDSYRNIFPIPSNIRVTNPNLEQNEGY